MVELNAELARICGELTGDGHIQIKEWRGLVSFYSKNYDTISDFESRFSAIFGVKGRIYTDTRRSVRYKLFFISKSIAKYLKSMEVPVGNKTNQPFYVPSWIFNGSSDLKSAYLRGLYNAEGCVSRSRNRAVFRYRIELEMYKREDYVEENRLFFSQLKKMLEDLGIKCSPVCFGSKNRRKDGSISVASRIAIERGQFGNFYKRVGFDDKLKAAKLVAYAEATESVPLPLRRFSASAGL